MVSYDIKKGIKKIKTKTAVAISGAVLASAGLVAALVMPLAAKAISPYTLTPWVYDPDQSCTGILSEWDQTFGNPSPSLHVTKPCTTETNASSGATINGVSGSINELDFDYLTAGHCGGGAPRYNVYTTNGTYFFFGCTAGTHTVSSTNPLWTHVEFTNSDAFPANGTTPWPGFGDPSLNVTGIDLVFDEGTNSDISQGTPGSAYLDNFSINGQVISGPNTPASKDACKKDGWKNLQDANGNSFKNQGQCVSYAQHTNGVGQDDTHAKNVRH
jgi:hypothetical protein